MGSAYNLTNLALIKLIFQSSAYQVSVQKLYTYINYLSTTPLGKMLLKTVDLLFRLS